METKGRDGGRRQHMARLGRSITAAGGTADEYRAAGGVIMVNKMEIMEAEKMSPQDTFRFRCDSCGKCCRNRGTSC